MAGRVALDADDCRCRSVPSPLERKLVDDVPVLRDLLVETNEGPDHILYECQGCGALWEFRCDVRSLCRLDVGGGG